MNNKYSNFKIAWFPDKLKSLYDDIITAPIYIRIKPTNRCCHNCYFCVYNYSFSKMHDSMKKIDEIPVDKMMEILEDLESIGVKAITYSGGGEPLIHKDIIQILKKTLDCGIDLSMLTNGQFLNGTIAKVMTRAKWIRISMDYWNENTFVESRKVSSRMFYQITENMVNFSKIKDNCDLGINYIITGENHDKLIEAFEFMASTGVDNIRFSPVWVPNFYDYHNNIKYRVRNQLDHIYRIKKNNIDVFDSYNISPIIDEREYKRCFFSRIVPVIGADFNIYTCHNMAYSPKGLIGSIKNNQFSDVWFSEDTKEFFQNFRPDISCNHQCANDTKNKIIHEIVNSRGDNYV